MTHKRTAHWCACTRAQLVNGRCIYPRPIDPVPLGYNQLCHKNTFLCIKLRHQTIKCSRGIGKALGHNQPLPNHNYWSTNHCERDIACSHEHLILYFNQVECTVHSTSCHVVLKNIISRNWCLCRYSGRIHPIISMYNKPLTIGLFDTKCRCGMRRLTLTYRPHRVLSSEKLFNDFTLFLWQMPLPCNAVFVPGTKSIL